MPHRSVIWVNKFSCQLSFGLSSVLGNIMIDVSEICVGLIYLRTFAGHVNNDLLLLLSASPVRGSHSGFPVSISCYLLHPHPSPQPLSCPLSSASINFLLGLSRLIIPGSSILSILSQYNTYPSSFLRTKPPSSCLSYFLAKHVNNYTECKTIVKGYNKLFQST